MAQQDDSRHDFGTLAFIFTVVAAAIALSIMSNKDEELDNPPPAKIELQKDTAGGQAVSQDIPAGGPDLP